jgi:hypothetical protein
MGNKNRPKTLKFVLLCVVNANVYNMYEDCKINIFIIEIINAFLPAEGMFVDQKTMETLTPMKKEQARDADDDDDNNI